MKLRTFHIAEKKSLICICIKETVIFLYLNCIFATACKYVSLHFLKFCHKNGEFAKLQICMFHKTLTDKIDAAFTAHKWHWQIHIRMKCRQKAYIYVLCFLSYLLSWINVLKQISEIVKRNKWKTRSELKDIRGKQNSGIRTYFWNVDGPLKCRFCKKLLLYEWNSG